MSNHNRNVHFNQLVRTPTGNKADLEGEFDTKFTRSHRVDRYNGPEHFQTPREKDLAAFKVERLGSRSPGHSIETIRNTEENRREVNSNDMRGRANFGDRSRVYNPDEVLGGGKRKSRGKRTKKGKKANKKSANKRKSAKKGRKSRKH